MTTEQSKEKAKQVETKKKKTKSAPRLLWQTSLKWLQALCYCD